MDARRDPLEDIVENRHSLHLGRQNISATRGYHTHANKHSYLVLKAGYDDLWQWSVECLADFWKDVWDYCKVIHSVEPHDILEANKNMDDIPIWFNVSLVTAFENLAVGLGCYRTGDNQNSNCRVLH